METERLNTEMARLNGEISLILETKKDAEYELISRPDDAEMHEALESLERDISARQRRIDRLQAAVAEAEKRDQSEVEAEEARKKLQAATQYSAEMKVCVDSAKDFEKLVRKLMTSLEEMSMHNQAAHTHKVEAGLHRLHDGFSDNIMTTSGAYLAKTLSESGFGERLMFVRAQPAMGDFMNPAEAAQQAADKASAIVSVRFYG